MTSVDGVELLNNAEKMAKKINCILTLRLKGTSNQELAPFHDAMNVSQQFCDQLKRTGNANVTPLFYCKLISSKLGQLTNLTVGEKAALKFYGIEIKRLLISGLREFGTMKDKEGFTPLHYAARYNHYYIAKFLVEWCNAGKLSVLSFSESDM